MKNWFTVMGIVLLLLSLPYPAQAATIVIDPGHGGFDRGATGVNGIFEKDINLDISLRLKAELSRRGFDAVLTRRTDTYLGLQDRVDFTDAKKADLFVSVHANSHQSPYIKGSLVLYYDRQYPQQIYPASETMKQLTPQSKELAQFILNALVTKVGTEDKGIVPSSAYVIRRGTAPSVLVETAFLSNREDAIRLAAPSFRQKSAIGLADGIQQYLDRLDPPVFRDIRSHWAREAIASLKEKGIVGGYEDLFFPNAPLTRAEYLVMLNRIFQFSVSKPVTDASADEPAEASPERHFADLASGHWAYSTLIQAIDRGFIHGYEDDTIRPDQAITRAEMVVLLDRILRGGNVETGKPLDANTAAPDESKASTFSDVPENSWAAPAILRLKSIGLINGVAIDLFAPDRMMTRAEGAVVLNRYLENSLPL